jgi:hypothetical protein
MCFSNIYTNNEINDMQLEKIIATACKRARGEGEKCDTHETSKGASVVIALITLIGSSPRPHQSYANPSRSVMG